MVEVEHVVEKKIVSVIHRYVGALLQLLFLPLDRNVFQETRCKAMKLNMNSAIN